MSTAPTLASKPLSLTVVRGRARSDKDVEGFLDEIGDLVSRYGQAQFFALATSRRVFALVCSDAGFDRFLCDNSNRALTSLASMLEHLHQEDDRDLVVYGLGRKAGVDQVIDTISQWMTLVASSTGLILECEGDQEVPQGPTRPENVGLARRLRPGSARVETNAPAEDRVADEVKEDQDQDQDLPPWDDKGPDQPKRQEIDEDSVLAVFEKTFGR